MIYDDNTIILMHGFGEVEEHGDTILGIDNDAREVMRWSIDDEAAAKAELAKHRCKYHKEKTFYGKTIEVADEWALFFCYCDEDDDFIGGSGNYILAEEEK